MNCMVREKFWNTEVINDKQDFVYPAWPSLVKKIKIVCLR